MRTLLQLQLLILLALPLGVSQAQSDIQPVTSPYEWSAQTVTAGGRVRVIITKHKPKLHLPKTQRPVVRLFADDRDDDYYDELIQFQVGYRRPELVDQTGDVEDISDEIKIRLLLARKRALEAHARKWA
jgi:hypothetical protein